MEYLLIGKITGFKGLKGEMKIKELSGFMEERLQPSETIYLIINDKYQSFTVESYNTQHKNHLLKLKGFNDINGIQHLIKLDIYANAKIELDLEEHEYHEDELIGLEVYQNNQLMGKVIDIRNYPKDDYLVVETDSGNALIPFRDEFIVEMTDKQIQIIDMEGLFWK